jgi:hypothetical protein
VIPELFLMFVLFSGAGDSSYALAMHRIPKGATLDDCLQEAERRNKIDPDVQIFAKGQGLWSCGAIVKPSV